jgi:hypothetical protein
MGRPPKLADHQIKMRAGESAQAIAKEMGVAHTTVARVSDIKRRAVAARSKPVAGDANPGHGLVARRATNPKFDLSGRAVLALKALDCVT